MTSNKTGQLGEGRPEPKRWRVLRFFAAGHSATRREAMVDHPHDPSLHTTVSELARLHNLNFAREPEYVAGYGGVPTRWLRYYLPPGEQEKARQALRVMDEKKPGGQAGPQKDSEQTSDRPDARGR